MTTHIAPVSDASPGLAVGQRIGSYRIERLLSDGGMGLVFEARHVNTGGRAAVKILRAEVACRQDVVARFFNEARATTSVEHPGIVRVFDCGYSAEGIAYLAMEFLDGESLATRLDRERKLPQSEALRIGRQIASAMRAAHAKGIIHRDLKPDNVMIVPDPELPSGERAKVVDFGIAKVTEGAQVRTQSGVVLGTPRYMSPEQCLSATNVTEHSDVYSLGIILYEMLSGRPPFEAEKFGELVGMHLGERPPPLSQTASAVGQSVADLVEVMLEKEPSRRPSMKAVAQTLSQLLGTEDSAQSLPEISGLPTERRVSLPAPVISRSIAFSPSLHLPPELRASPDEPTVPDPKFRINGALAPSALSDPVAELITRPAPTFPKKHRFMAPLAGLSAMGISIWLLLRFLDHGTHGPSMIPAKQQEPRIFVPTPLPPTISTSANAGSESKQNIIKVPSKIVKTQSQEAKSRIVHFPSLKERAEQQFRDRSYYSAINLAIDLKEKDPKAAACIIGHSSCRLRIPSLVNQAISELMAIEAQDTERLIDNIYSDCKGQGLVAGMDGKVQIDNSIRYRPNRQ